MVQDIPYSLESNKKETAVIKQLSTYVNTHEVRPVNRRADEFGCVTYTIHLCTTTRACQFRTMVSNTTIGEIHQSWTETLVPQGVLLM